MLMKAARFYKGEGKAFRVMPGTVEGTAGFLKIEEVSVPGIAEPNDVLIEVKACGICGTDLQILLGGHPANDRTILGHEYAGMVRDVGKDVWHVKPGDRVVVDPNLKCGRCFYCRCGQENLCENMTTLGIFKDGGFANYNVAPEGAVHKIPPDMPYSQSTLVEPVSCVVHGIKRADIQPGDHVVVLGAGPIGLIFSQLIKALYTLKIIVSETDEYRLRKAGEIGIDVLVNPKRQDVKKEVLSQTNNRGADVVVEATGVLAGQALDLVRKGGKVLLFGMNERAEAKIKPYYITRYQLSILGSFIANYTFQPAIDLLFHKRIDANTLITHEYPLEELPKGMDLMYQKKCIKVVIKP